MTRIQDILTKARYTLADPNANRWSDARLIQLIDECQTDLAKHTKILKAEADLIPLTGIGVGELPSDVWLITRAAFDSCKIGLHTHDELDELVRTQAVNSTTGNRYYQPRYGSSSSDFGVYNYCWELEESNTIEALIYDRRNTDEIKYYPIPKTDTTVDFGVATSIDDLTIDTYGVVTGSTELIISDIYGVISEFSIGTVHIWYIKMPAAVAVVTDELEMPGMWDTAFKHYVIANAFDDDYDSKFAAKSEKAGNLYLREVELLQKTSCSDGVRDSNNRSDYRGAFEN